MKIKRRQLERKRWAVLRVFRVKSAKRYEWPLHFEVKMPENGRKNIFSDKQTTNNIPLVF